MKKICLLVMIMAGFIASITQASGQGTSIIDAKTVLGKDYLQPGGLFDPGAGRNSCLYILDDGIQDNSLGLTAGGDIMWLNYFQSTPGCELIHTVSLAWGNMPNGGTCRIILYDDPTNDGNPNDAVYLTETSTTVENANTNIFKNVSITPTQVSGGFFVAALFQNSSSGTFPAPIDQTVSQMNSWASFSSSGAFNVLNLTGNDALGLIDSFGFPGNWLLRAEGSAVNPNQIPLSNWALFIGLGLIVAFTVIRFRRIS